MGPVDVVTASAGTGKTYRLVQEATAALDAGLTPERLMAVTFTTRAAAELLERIRTHLLVSGRAADAERLLAARIGTVHSVFGGLLSEFALADGRSPVAEVLAPGSAQELFSMAADQAIAGCAREMDSLADRLGFHSRRSRLDWRKLVHEIAAAAQSNGIEPSELQASADQSWQTLHALLPTPDPAGEAMLDAALADAVDHALGALPANPATKVTQDALPTLREAQAVLGGKRKLSWPQWAKLSKLKVAKADAAAVARVIEAARAHFRHPRLAADLEAVIRHLFAAAATAMKAFSAYKSARGVVDFADQEAVALQLLRLPEVREALRERVGLLLVDEFQDTNPMQLELFSAMAAVVERSVWVGDPKQAVYGFRGADPELMGTVSDRMPGATGGKQDTLSTSRRSRPGLVAFLDALFVPAFEALGLERSRVALVRAARAEPDGGPAVTSMPLVAGSQAEESQMAAGGVAAMLGNPSAWQVQGMSDAAPRALRPGDVAVLCRRNERCSDIASALERLGIRTAIGRPGLLASAEVAAAVAALRWAVDPDDRLAIAELARLFRPDGTEWLDAALDPDGAALGRLVPGAAALQALRRRLLHLTPREALDEAMEAGGIPPFAASLGDAGSRMANLEALRALALDYEEGRAVLELPATAAGLAAWLQGQKEAERPADPGDDAVQVMTVHAAKGLEWPLVVLADLGEPPAPRLFDSVCAEREGGAVDISHPLAGRWLRYWPWPYGDQSVGVGLDAVAPGSPEGRGAEERARGEGVRLLYVAMTRARDHLVLAPRFNRGSASAEWLDRLVGPDGTPLLRLPSDPGAPILVRSAEHPARYVATVAETPAGAGGRGPVFVAPPAPTPLPVHPVLRLRPSSAGGDGECPGFRVIELGPRLALVGDPAMEGVGEAVHSFLAADDPFSGTADRLGAAARALRSWNVEGALSPADVVAAGDRLMGWIASRWPDAELEREVPITGRVGLQRVSGRIDLLVRSGTQASIFDHKTFPGSRNQWPERVRAIVPQLECYREVCAGAGVTVAGVYIHLPVVGALLEVE